MIKYEKWVKISESYSLIQTGTSLWLDHRLTAYLCRALYTR